MKKDTHLFHINFQREQFAEAACQKGIDLPTPPTHSNNDIDVNVIGNDGIYSKEYDNDDKDFSYHSSDGSANEEAVAQREFGHEAVGTLPMATSRSKEGATHNFVQMDGTPDWLHEISNNQMSGKADLISAFIIHFFP